jgi:hypothetical protein
MELPAKIRRNIVEKYPDEKFVCWVHHCPVNLLPSTPLHPLLKSAHMPIKMQFERGRRAASTKNVHALEI